MKFDDIQLWFAKDSNGKIVTIDKIDKDNKHEKYTCPICGSEVICKTGEINRWHFAHRDASKCSSEAQVHFWIKNELIKKGETFKIKLDNEIKEFVCKEILIEQQYKTEFGIYNPDITIITDNEETIYFEVTNTNKKKTEEYIDMWLELNNIVVEVEKNDLINGNSLKEFKSIDYKKYKFNKDINKDIQKICKKNKKKFSDYINDITWLLNDCYKYIDNEIEIDELFYEIGELDNRYIFLNILEKNNTCNSIYNDLKDFEIKSCEKELKLLESLYSGNIQIKYNNKNTYKIVILSRLYNDIYEMNDEWEQIYASTGFSLWDLSYIKKYINRHVKFINDVKIRNNIFNSCTFNKAMEDINKYLKSIDEKYLLHRSEIEDYEIKKCNCMPCNWQNNIKITIAYEDKELEPSLSVFRNIYYNNITINIDDNFNYNSYEYLYNLLYEKVKDFRKSFSYKFKYEEYKSIKYIINRLYNNFEQVNPLSHGNNTYDKTIKLEICTFEEGNIKFTIRNTDFYTIFKNGKVYTEYDYRDINLLFENINESNKELIYNKIINLYADKVRLMRYGIKGGIK